MESVGVWFLEVSSERQPHVPASSATQIRSRPTALTELRSWSCKVFLLRGDAEGSTDLAFILRLRATVIQRHLNGCFDWLVKCVSTFTEKPRKTGQLLILVMDTADYCVKNRLLDLTLSEYDWCITFYQQAACFPRLAHIADWANYG